MTLTTITERVPNCPACLNRPELVLFTRCTWAPDFHGDTYGRRSRYRWRCQGCGYEWETEG